MTDDKIVADAWMYEVGDLGDRRWAVSVGSFDPRIVHDSGKQYLRLYSEHNPALRALISEAEKYADMCNKAGIFADGDLRAALRPFVGKEK